jgi:Tfp pilus assembly protein PilV
MKGCHSRAVGDSGFALIETLVSAVVLIVIALATLAAVDRAQSTSAVGKGRSVAAALAEQDQERIRALPTASLSTYRLNRPPTRQVTVGALNYDVASTVDWVRDSTGGTQSCTSDTTQADYLKITSTVTGRAVRPVTISSLVAAPLAYSATRGTLAVKVVDGADAPVVGLTVSLSGPTSASDTTNAVGCAVFQYIPTGTYTARYSQTGWVDPSGDNTIDATKIVNAGATSLLELKYDRASALTVQFETNLGTAAAPVLSRSRGWSATGANDAVPGSKMRSADAVSYPQPAASIALNDLFPFRDGYQTYSGECAGANPVSAIPLATWFSSGVGADDFVILAPGDTTRTVIVRQPALKVRVRTGTSTYLQGAHVVITPRDATCAPRATFTTTTNPVSTGNGWVSKPSYDFGSPTGVVAYDPGVPFGAYDICADAITGTGTGLLRRKASLLNVNVNNAAGVTAGPITILTSGTTTAGTCPG